ncbi:hypothetical protein B0H11DRAFT_2215552 [Mycena galericulata]|nr:hypothetical protein B0H11DRAFT_2215552 [Mycena galericulata]
MSLTLPIHALAAMRVSIKIGPEGTLAFDMIHTSGQEISVVELDGMKLHLHSVADPTGVTLSLFLSGQPTQNESLGVACNLNSQPVSCSDPPITEFAFPISPGLSDVDFFSDASGVETCDPLPADMQLGSFDPPQAFDVFEILQSLESQVFDVYHSQSNTNGPDLSLSASTPASGSEHPIFDFSPSAESTASYLHTPPYLTPPEEILSPRVSSMAEASLESSGSASPAAPVSGTPLPRLPSSRPDLCCPAPSCGRSFTSKYTLSKHTQTHLRKTHPSFTCSMGCNLEFSRRHDRLRHEVKQHARVCEWECKACLGFFSSKMTLKKHKCRARGK